MGKAFVLGIAIALGYSIGYRDARKHPQHIASRAVDKIRTTFGGGKNHNDIDAVMTRVEGKN